MGRERMSNSKRIATQRTIDPSIAINTELDETARLSHQFDRFAYPNWFRFHEYFTSVAEVKRLPEQDRSSRRTLLHDFLSNCRDYLLMATGTFHPDVHEDKEVLGEFVRLLANAKVKVYFSGPITVSDGSSSDPASNQFFDELLKWSSKRPDFVKAYCIPGDESRILHCVSNGQSIQYHSYHAATDLVRDILVIEDSQLACHYAAVQFESDVETMNGRQVTMENRSSVGTWNQADFYDVEKAKKHYFGNDQGLEVALKDS